jgi:hypothetical protein
MYVTEGAGWGIRVPTHTGVSVWIVEGNSALVTVVVAYSASFMIAMGMTTMKY